MVQITEEYRQYNKKFKEVFGYGIPLNMIPPTASTEDLIKQIRDCIENKKDNLLDKFSVTTNDMRLF